MITITIPAILFPFIFIYIIIEVVFITEIRMTDNPNIINNLNGWVHLDRLGNIENGGYHDVIYRLKSFKIPDDVKIKYKRDDILDKLLNN